MTKIESSIDGVEIWTPEKFDDSRGWLIELFRSDSLPEGFEPEMCYLSSTSPGKIRGPHEHKYQTDYFFIIGPSEIEISLWDNRPESNTYREHMKIVSDAERRLFIMIPPGVVHGYKNTGNQDGLIFNAPNKLYAGRNKTEVVDEIRHEDNPESKFNIE